MVKALFLGLLAATMCGFMCASPIITAKAVSHLEESPSPSAPGPPLEDPAARSERSTNLSHVTGTARKIQMFIKNRHLQILPDGTVNGTTDDTSSYTILQRTTVGIGQMKIQGVATCQYLCMDICGLVYGSREFGDECVFSEAIGQHNYNTYSSRKYSNDEQTFYLALNRRGQPKRLVLKAGHQLGKMTKYSRVLTRNVAPERVEELHHMRHHGRACPSPQGYSPHQPHQQHQPQQSPDPPRCRKRRKRKKKKRKCDEEFPELCQKKLKCEKDNKNNRDSEGCQRDVTIKKKNKNNVSEKHVVSDLPKKKKNKKGVRKRLGLLNVSTEATTSAIPPTSTISPDEATPDEDYGVDSSTHMEWEDSTAIPDISMAVSEAKIAPNSHSDSD